MPNLKDKVAVITGASSGIGAVTAIHFAELGCNLSIIGRNKDRLEDTVSKCVKAGLKANQVLASAVDINDDAAVTSVVKKTIEHFGKLDILINNAGILLSIPIEGGTMSDFDNQMKTNFRSPFHLIQLVTPHLKKTKGNIVNVSSAVSIKPYPGGAIYGGSKAALDYLTRTAALELGPYGIRVNAVAPGAVQTDLFRDITDNTEAAKKVLDRVAKSHALKRYSQPIEMAKPIAFLASDDASFVTGAYYLIDGGYNLIGGGLGIELPE